MLAGVAVHLAALDLPFVELAVAGSVLALGAVLALQARLSAGLAAALFAVAGLFHGYAYGESIVGAEQTPLAAYLIGLVAVQYAIALGALEIARRLQASGRAAPALRIAGAAVVVVGAAFLALNVAG
jgi:urease accessory protein